MTEDRFIAIKAQLNNINKQADSQAAEDLDKFKELLQALKKIQDIPDDDVGNGLRLAKSIAETAIEVYYARS